MSVKQQCNIMSSGCRKEEMVVVPAGEWQNTCQLSPSALPSSVRLGLYLSPARKQEIIKVTEQLIEAINNGDFEAYT